MKFESLLSFGTNSRVFLQLCLICLFGPIVQRLNSITSICFYSVLLLQYGPIVHIDLKIPPRPPGYAFVEVSLTYFGYPFFVVWRSSFFFFSFSFKSSFLITVWRGSWCWRCDSRARWLWFWWASPTGWFHCCGTYFWSQLIDLVKLTCEFQSLRLSLRMVGVGTLHLQTIIAVVVVGVPVVECPGAQNTEVDKSFHMWISECNISVMISKFRQILSHFVSSSSYDNWPASFCFVARS